ncbi:hypothetical protein MTR67_035599, partial [Solanum verrucosum]
RNVDPQDQWVPNEPEVQPQGEVTNVEFRNAIRMLSQVVTNQVEQQRGNRQDVADIFRILFGLEMPLRMNPPDFIGSSVIEDPENFVEELQKVFEKIRVEGALIVSLAVFEENFLGCFFHREVREAMVRNFLNLKYEFMSVHEYNLKITQLSRYSPEIVIDMNSKMSLFVSGLSRLSSKKGKDAILIGTGSGLDLRLGVKVGVESQVGCRGRVSIRKVLGVGFPMVCKDCALVCVARLGSNPSFNVRSQIGSESKLESSVGTKSRIDCKD